MNRQKGAALVTALVCLIMVSLMGVIAVRTSSINAKVSSNAKKAAQTMHLAASAVNQFFINPRAIWNLRTVQGQVTEFPQAQVGSANVNLQAEYTGDLPCPISIGVALSPNKQGGTSECIYFRVASNYQNQSSGESTVSSGFWSKKD